MYLTPFSNFTFKKFTAKGAKRHEKQSTLLPSTAKVPKFEKI
jgi:hypothetical protein